MLAALWNTAGHGLTQGVMEASPETARTAALLQAGGVDRAIQWLDGYPVLAAFVGLAVLFGFAGLVLALSQRYVLRIVASFVRRSPTWWDEVLLDRAFFYRLSWAVPLLIVRNGIPLVPHLPDAATTVVQRVALACLILVAVRAIAALLGGINEIYSRYPTSRDRPIKGYLQVVNVVVHLLAIILIVAALMDRSPVIFLTGLGAMTAVLLLVFRDTLLSLVAGVQLTGNNLIRVGDWIEMPQFNADGDVIDIALNTVSVQNWDRTITVIPTHKFLEHSFRNWRGMEESGGRRIKRSIPIDTSTIRFLNDREIERFGRFALLKDYVAGKQAELEAYNRAHVTDSGDVANARRLTNMGTFRAYVVNYLRQHPKVHHGMIMLVRQLDPTPEGLPLEIYVFTNDTAWVNYESIQSDIFDHLLAMVPEFGLRVFQKPGGGDLAAIGAELGATLAATRERLPQPVPPRQPA